jgi:pSer/pThr/pTyr-binding forkhead associated (FHA) protein
VQDINASRRHADLTLNQQGLWVITDLSSMNGTLVNGVSVASQPLYPGDIVTIGKTDFEFVLV